MELASKSHSLPLNSKSSEPPRQNGIGAYLRRRSVYDWIFLLLFAGVDAYVLSQ